MEKVANARAIATHDGFITAGLMISFHVFRRLGFSGELRRLMRPSDLSGEDLVLDIGGVYDPARGRFDRMGCRERRESGVLYSTAGLVWRSYGAAVCDSVASRHQVPTEELVRAVDATIIQGADRADWYGGLVDEISCSFHRALHQAAMRFNRVNLRSIKAGVIFECAIDEVEELFNSCLWTESRRISESA